MQHSGSHSSHSADSSRRERSSRAAYSERDYADYMEDEVSVRSGRSNSSRSKSSGSGNTMKFVLLGVVLLLIVAVLALLFVRGCSSDSGEITNAAAEANVSSSVLAQDAYGKDMGKSLAISAGTLAPADVNPADAVLLDITWNGKKSADYPLVLTVSDPSFVDGNGLIVFHYTNGQWVKVGTYTIANNAVTFLADSLSPFAFVPYEKYNTATPEPSATPTPALSPSPSPSTSPSPSVSPSVSPSPTAANNSNNSIYQYDPDAQYINEEDVPSIPTQAPVQTNPPTQAPDSSSDIPTAAPTEAPVIEDESEG